MFTHIGTRRGDVRDASASAAKLRQLDWRPKVSLARGIRALLGAVADELPAG